MNKREQKKDLIRVKKELQFERLTATGRRLDEIRREIDNIQEKLKRL